MTAMTHCTLCFQEFEEYNLPGYNPKIPELCCKYLHSSLTQKTAACQSNQNNLQFCQKCFERVVELHNFNDQLELYQKRISEFVFILSLEILHRRSEKNCDQNQLCGSWKRKLIEFDVSALPNCDFSKTATVNTEEVEVYGKEILDFNSEDSYEKCEDPLLIPSNPNGHNFDFEKLKDGTFKHIEDGRNGDSAATDHADTFDLILSDFVDAKADEVLPITFEKIKVDTDAQKRMDCEIHDVNRTEVNDHQPLIKKANQTFLTEQSKSKILIPTVRLQRLNFHERDGKAIFVENDQGDLHHLNQSNTLEGCGGSEVQSEKHECDICGKLLKSKSSLWKHEFFVHTSKRPFRCEICKKRFKTKQSLQQHKTTHSQEKPFKCDGCETRFVTKFNLSRHQKIHTRERQYKCEVCDKRFARQDRLMVHSMHHTILSNRNNLETSCTSTLNSTSISSSNQQITDADLAKAFITNPNNDLEKQNGRLNQSNLLEDGLRNKILPTGQEVDASVQSEKHQCGVCGKLLNSERCLRTHILHVHTKERTFNCEICKQRFKDQLTLQRHKMTHGQEKPFKCDVCGTEFFKKFNMERHRKVHTREQYICKVCDVRFIRQDELVLHTIKNHDGEPYKL